MTIISHLAKDTRGHNHSFSVGVLLMSHSNNTSEAMTNIRMMSLPETGPTPCEVQWTFALRMSGLSPCAFPSPTEGNLSTRYQTNSYAYSALISTQHQSLSFTFSGTSIA